MTITNEISQLSESLREELSDRYFRVDEYCTGYVWIEELDENREPTENYLQVSYKVTKFLYQAGQLKPLGGETYGKYE